MSGQRIGYIRVSSFDQKSERQLDGVPVDRVFVDKVSGKDTKRPELERMLAFVRESDTVVVHSMDRLARNLDDLRRLVQELPRRGIAVQFVKENLRFTGEDSPMATLMLSVMDSFAEFERALIRERQREGIALAKQRGAYRGRKRALSPAQVAELQRRIAAGEGKGGGCAGVWDQPRNAVSVFEAGGVRCLFREGMNLCIASQNRAREGTNPGFGPYWRNIPVARRVLLVHWRDYSTTLVLSDEEGGEEER